MSALIKLFQTQPAKVTAAIQAIFGALLAIEVIHLSAVQIGAIIIAANAVLGLFVAAQVTPNVKLPDSVVIAAAEGHPPIPEVPGVPPQP